MSFGQLNLVVERRPASAILSLMSTRYLLSGQLAEVFVNGRMVELLSAAE